MGGCYSSSYGSGRASSSYGLRGKFENFLKTGDLEQLVLAYKSIIDSNSSGFIAELASFSGLSSVDAIPKEFVGIEYEVKFDIGLMHGKGAEPEIKDYLDAFDFPPSRTARFLKDPVHNVAEGVNSFLGDDLDEKLVVIEKGGKLYMKEKGPVIPMKTGVQYEDIVIKRKEERHQATVEELVNKLNSLTADSKIKYTGRIRKEKGDDFLLDTSDGRIYSFTITRAHLVKPGSKEETQIQRQLEVEYAGYIPGFSGFAKDSEKQIAQGMVDVAKYTFGLYSSAPIKNGWSIQLAVTSERKYDFVKEKSIKGKNPLRDLALLGEPKAKVLVGSKKQEKNAE